MKIKRKAAPVSSPALELIFTEYLRPYQLDFLMSGLKKKGVKRNKWRVVNKARQIGFSDAIALEMVLTASGLLHPFRLVHNCNIISKSQKDADEVIEKASAWCLRFRQDPILEPFFRLRAENKSTLTFRNGRKVQSQAQTKHAGRGKSGHLYFDEYSFFGFQREIWLASVPSIGSKKGLTLTVVSTPNGTNEHFFDLCTSGKYHDWWRYTIDVHSAVSQGFNFDFSIRKTMDATQWEQEYECKFFGGADDFFSHELLMDSIEQEPYTPSDEVVTIFGVDLASDIDKTAVQVIYHEPSTSITRLANTYVISRTAYQTNLHKKVMGQEWIIQALIETYRPDYIVCDTTGQAAMAKRRGSRDKLLMPTLKSYNDNRMPVVIEGHTISAGWKKEQSHGLREALGQGQVMFMRDRQEYSYDPTMAHEFIQHSCFPEFHQIPQFMDQCFDESNFPVLISDFKRVFTKWLEASHTESIQTKRDEHGHGDSYWGACLAYFKTTRLHKELNSSRPKRSQMSAQPRRQLF